MAFGGRGGHLTRLPRCCSSRTFRGSVSSGLHLPTGLKQPDGPQSAVSLTTLATAMAQWAGGPNHPVHCLPPWGGRSTTVQSHLPSRFQNLQVRAHASTTLTPWDDRAALEQGPHDTGNARGPGVLGETSPATSPHRQSTSEREPPSPAVGPMVTPLGPCVACLPSRPRTPCREAEDRRGSPPTSEPDSRCQLGEYSRDPCSRACVTTASAPHRSSTGIAGHDHQYQNGYRTDRHQHSERPRKAADPASVVLVRQRVLVR